MGKQWKQAWFSWAPKITADHDCSREMKRRLLLGWKVMTNLDSILKSRDITLTTKAHIVFPVAWKNQMCGCESWTVKKAEHQRIDTFELWCWIKLLRVPSIARRSNQSILKEISPKHSLEGLMLKLKLQYFGHLMGRTDSLEKTLILAKIEGKRRRDVKGWDGWMASLTDDGITDGWWHQWTGVWASCRSWWWTKRPGVLQSIGSQRVRHDWVTELSWTCWLETFQPHWPKEAQWKHSSFHDSSP